MRRSGRTRGQGAPGSAGGSEEVSARRLVWELKLEFR